MYAFYFIRFIKVVVSWSDCKTFKLLKVSFLNWELVKTFLPCDPCSVGVAIIPKDGTQNPTQFSSFLWEQILKDITVTSFLWEQILKDITVLITAYHSNFKILVRIQQKILRFSCKCFMLFFSKFCSLVLDLIFAISFGTLLSRNIMVLRLDAAQKWVFRNVFEHCS